MSGHAQAQSNMKTCLHFALFNKDTRAFSELLKPINDLETSEFMRKKYYVFSENWV